MMSSQSHVRRILIFIPRTDLFFVSQIYPSNTPSNDLRSNAFEQS